jgi:hypothetical protein
MASHNGSESVDRESAGGPISVHLHIIENDRGGFSIGRDAKDIT